MIRIQEWGAQRLRSEVAREGSVGAVIVAGAVGASTAPAATLRGVELSLLTGAIEGAVD